jgi:hypothetical protein
MPDIVRSVFEVVQDNPTCGSKNHPPAAHPGEKSTIDAYAAEIENKAGDTRAWVENMRQIIDNLRRDLERRASTQHFIQEQSMSDNKRRTHAMVHENATCGSNKHSPAARTETKAGDTGSREEQMRQNIRSLRRDLERISTTIGCPLQLP